MGFSSASNSSASSALNSSSSSVQVFWWAPSSSDVQACTPTLRPTVQTTAQIQGTQIHDAQELQRLNASVQQASQHTSTHLVLAAPLPPQLSVSDLHFSRIFSLLPTHTATNLQDSVSSGEVLVTPALPELFACSRGPVQQAQQVQQVRVVQSLAALSTLVCLMLQPLIQRGVLLPKMLKLHATLSPDYQDTKDLSEAEQWLTGRFPLELHTQYGDQHRAHLSLTAAAWVPDGWSEHDIWSTYREAYARFPRVFLCGRGQNWQVGQLPDQASLGLALGELDHQSGALELRGQIDIERCNRLLSLCSAGLGCDE